MDEDGKFLVTRPKLADELFAAGVKGSRCPNPYRPEFRAWSFEATDEAWDVVSRFYALLGLNVPSGTRRKFEYR